MNGSKSSSSSWLGCLCRPQHPDATGVAVAPRSLMDPPPKVPPTTTTESVRPSRVAFVPKKNPSHLRNDPQQQIPMIPSAPSDDATPVMNNLRKRGGSKRGSPLLPPEPLLTAPFQAAEEEGLLFANPSSDSSFMKPTVSEESNDSKGSRKSRPSYYPNHVQENIKAKREYYEQHAFTSPRLPCAAEDTTESTDVTDSTDADALTEPTLRVDCQEDPFESAYVVWYHKGLLKWRPKSMPAAEMDGTQPHFTFATSSSAPPQMTRGTMENHKTTMKESLLSVDTEKSSIPPPPAAAAASPVVPSVSKRVVAIPAEVSSTVVADTGLPSTPTRIRLYQEEASRSSSLRKSRQAPLISVFGSPRRLTAASY